MLLNDLYSRIVAAGVKNDTRTENEINAYLTEQKQTYEELTEKQKQYFDQEKFFNPYSDTRILNGYGNENIDSILVGIDVETQDLLLAAHLCSQGTKIDAVLTHHPEGKPLAELAEVMHIQENVLNKLGVPINVAENLLSSRISEVKRGLLPFNHARTVTAAKMLKIPFMCAHTPADNCVQNYLETIFAEQQPKTLDDIIDCLLTIPEYQAAAMNGVGPTIIIGDKKRSAGKIFVDMTGGTSGPEEIYPSLQNAGIGTVIAMHMGEKHRKEAEKNHINVIIAGHMASDSLGMNLLLDSVLPDGVNVIGFSGFERVKR